MKSKLCNGECSPNRDANPGIIGQAYWLYCIYCVITGLPLVFALVFVGFKSLMMPGWAIAAGGSALITGLVVERFIQKEPELALIKKITLLFFSSMLPVVFLAGMDDASDGETTNERLHHAMLGMITLLTWFSIFVLPLFYWVGVSASFVTKYNKKRVLQ